jgi:hypothetical protein
MTLKIFNEPIPIAEIIYRQEYENILYIMCR